MPPPVDPVKLEWVEQEAHSLRSAFQSLGRVYVPGEGDNASAFIVGEAPGATEEIMRRPFVGRCAVLRDLMALASLHTTDLYEDGRDSAPTAGANVWLTNVVKFRPPNNRNPTTPEIKAFRKLLQDEWQAVGAPPLIIPVGGIALSAIFGKPMSILRAAGKCHYTRSTYTGKELHIWPMVHPSFVIRQPGNIQLQDLIEQDWERLGVWRRHAQH